MVAIDLGATSGRVIAVEVAADEPRLELRELHRFPNGAVRGPDGRLRWDFERIVEEVLVGLGIAGASGPVHAVGIDSWGVDYGLLGPDGELLGQPYSHRDERTAGIAARVAAEVGAEALYAITGIQGLPFNTVYQLVADRDAGDLERAARLLLVPDLLAYRLTGRVVAERTNASTTQLLDATTGQWSTDLLDRLDLPSGVLPPLLEPGTVIGTLTDPVCRATGLDPRTEVIAVGSHDTASAVVGVPARDDRFAYVSSGTWSLVGVELPRPILGEEARRANFTNEAGVDHTVRFLKNVMGLWVLSECLRDWSLSLPELLAAAGGLPSSGVIDIDDPRLLPPGDMVGRVRALAGEAGIDLDDSAAPLVRLVLDSLAAAYAANVVTASSVAQVAPDVVHVVGGGSQNALLCQLTADACGLPVMAGPTEAAALGNALVQARTLGEPLPTLDAMRSLVRATQPLTRYDSR